MADQMESLKEMAAGALDLANDETDAPETEETTEELEESAVEDGGEQQEVEAGEGEQLTLVSDNLADGPEQPVGSHDPSDVAPAPEAVTTDADSPVDTDDVIKLSDEEAKTLMFDLGDGEPVSLETLRKERMPRDHFLRKNTELDQAKKQYESALSQLQEIDNFARTDTVGYIESVIQQGVNAGSLSQEQASALQTAINFMEKNAIYDRSIPQQQFAQQQAVQVQHQAQAVESEREMLQASQDFLQQTGVLPSQLPEADRQGIFNYITNKRMLQPDAPVDFVEALQAVRQFSGQQQAAPTQPQVSQRQQPVAKPSRSKVIEQIRRTGTATTPRAGGSADAVESANDLAARALAVLKR